MNLLDIFILVVIGLGIWRGYKGGIINEVTPIVAIVAAFIFGVNLMEPVGEMIVDSLGISAEVSTLLGFIAVFAVVMGLTFMLGRSIESAIGALKLSGANRMLGGMLGAFKSALILSMAFLVTTQFGFPDQDTRDGSQFYHSTESLVGEVWGLVSDRWPEVERLSDKFIENRSIDLEDLTPDSQ